MSFFTKLDLNDLIIKILPYHIRLYSIKCKSDNKEDKKTPNVKVELLEWRGGVWTMDFK